MDVLEQFELDKIELQSKIVSELEMYEIDLNIENPEDFINIEQTEDYLKSKENEFLNTIHNFINLKLEQYVHLPLIKIYSGDTHIINGFSFTLEGILGNNRIKLYEINGEFRKKTKLYF